MQIHTIKRHTKRKTSKRVGRSGNHGKTSGRGHKGQKSRAGGTPRPDIRDMIKKLPKRRGYKAPQVRVKGENVNVSSLEQAYKSGDIVSPNTLLKKGLIRKVSGKFPKVKILGTGEIKKKLVCVRCDVSEAAKVKIEAAGGKIASRAKVVEEKKEDKK